MARWNGCNSFARRLSVCSQQDDRRDAALLLSCAVIRYRHFPVDLPPLKVILPQGILDCGGAIMLPGTRGRRRVAT